jgi:hypothetical protein
MEVERGSWFGGAEKELKLAARRGSKGREGARGRCRMVEEGRTWVVLMWTRAIKERASRRKLPLSFPFRLLKMKMI